MYQLNNNQTQQTSATPLFSNLPPSSYNSRLDADATKKKSYNIDYIVSDQSTPEVQQSLVPVSSNQTKNANAQHSIHNQNFEDEQKQKSAPKEGGVYRYPDICADVKHARTPLNTVNQETHSPQLPIPSPNYPVQAEAQLPNTVVPTINNNYITTPHATSQCDLKENTTPSTECCQPHSNRLNNKSDLKQTDHLSNVDLGESKRNNTIINLNKVNLPVVKTECSAKKVQDTENSFTVLNIPSLTFQAPLPSKKPKLSKIDLATLKRKMRRKKRLKTEKLATKIKNENGSFTDTSGSSYCSSTESESESTFRNLWIKTGPPSKPDMKPEKVEFFKLFGLTTHPEKNGKCLRDISIQKITFARSFLLNFSTSEHVKFKILFRAPKYCVTSLLPICDLH